MQKSWEEEKPKTHGQHIRDTGSSIKIGNEKDRIYQLCLIPVWGIMISPKEKPTISWALTMSPGDQASARCRLHSISTLVLPPSHLSIFCSPVLRWMDLTPCTRTLLPKSLRWLSISSALNLYRLAARDLLIGSAFTQHHSFPRSLESRGSPHPAQTAQDSGCGIWRQKAWLGGPDPPFDLSVPHVS